MLALTFADQVKLILKRKKMSIKLLAEQIEEKTDKKMSRQNLTQKLARNNFQEEDMRLIAEVLGCKYQLSIMEELSVGETSTVVNQAFIDAMNQAAKVGDLPGIETEDEAEDSALTIEEKMEEEVIKIKKAEKLAAETAAKKAAKKAEAEEAKAATKKAEAAAKKAALKKAKEEAAALEAEKLAAKKEEEEAIKLAAEESERVAAEAKKPAKKAKATKKAKKSDGMADFVQLSFTESGEVEETAPNVVVPEKVVKASKSKAKAEPKETKEVKAEAKVESKVAKKVKEEPKAEAKKVEVKEEKVEKKSATKTAKVEKPVKEVATSEVKVAPVKEDVAKVEVKPVAKVKAVEAKVAPTKITEAKAAAVKAEVKPAVKVVTPQPVAKAPAKVAPPQPAAKAAPQPAAKAAPQPAAKAAAKATPQPVAKAPTKAAPQPAAKTPAKAATATKPSKFSFFKGLSRREGGEVKPDINPFTGIEYKTNSVRTHPKKVGYVQVYDRKDHKWADMTEWAFIAYQERKLSLLGKKYEEPTYLD